MSYTTYRFKAPILKGLADVQLSEPTPELKEALKHCSSGKDLILASTQKDHAEKGPFIWTMNELSKTTLGYGTRMLVLCNDETRVKKVVTFLRKLGEQLAFDAEPIMSEMEPQKVTNIIGKAPHAIVGTPAVIKESLESNRALLRDVNLLYITGAHKMDSYEDIKAIFPRVLSPKQRVVQLSKKASMALRLEVLTWVRDPHHVGIDPPVEGLETVSPAKTSVEIEVDSKVETQEKQLESKDQVQDKKDESTHHEDDKELLQTITPLLKRAMIPNGLPLATVVKRIKESSSERAVVFCQGPAEADALFKELREADLGVISVHSKLRRSTYEYRLNRFQSGDVNIAIIGGRLKSNEPLKQVSRVLYTLLPRTRDTFLHDMRLVKWSEVAQECLFLIQEKDKESFETFKKESGLECTPLVLDGLNDLKPIELLDRRKDSRNKDPRHKDRSSSKTNKKPGDKSSKGSSSKRSKNRGQESTHSQNASSQNGSQQSSKTGNKPKKHQGKGRGKRNEKPKTPYGLPRANFDRLDGGKEGSKPSGGLFGAIKKIFGN